MRNLQSQIRNFEVITGTESACFCEKAAKQPYRQQDQRGAQRTEIVPAHGMALGGRSDGCGDKDDGKKGLPADLRSDDAENRVYGIVDFFAGEAAEP